MTVRRVLAVPLPLPRREMIEGMWVCRPHAAHGRSERRFDWVATGVGLVMTAGVALGALYLLVRFILWAWVELAG